ncbi:MAG: MarR family transcriptional regulator [Gammaproteobacteria bacterium]|nr:MarR family transcriptional regulator [Gammaproteobacteria bacterium]
MAKKDVELAERLRDVDLDILPEILGFNVKRAENVLWREYSEAIGEFVVKHGTFSVMVLIGANAGIAQTEIAKTLFIDKAIMVSLIDNLEELGWVVRKRATYDRRCQTLYLTDDGKDVLSQLKRRVRQHEKKFSDRFTPAELSQFQDFLRRILE